MIDSTPRFPVILPVTLSSKKGDVQPFFLGILENVPAPCIESSYSRRWQGLETLTIPGSRLPGTYSGSLLYQDSGDLRVCFPRSPSPVWRGQECGQVSIEQFPCPGKLKTRVQTTHGCPSGDKWLSESLIPIFEKAIVEHADTLRQHALTSLRNSLLDWINRLKADAIAREKEANAIMAALGSHE